MPVWRCCGCADVPSRWGRAGPCRRARRGRRAGLIRDVSVPSDLFFGEVVVALGFVGGVSRERGRGVVVGAVSRWPAVFSLFFSCGDVGAWSRGPVWGLTGL